MAQIPEENWSSATWEGNRREQMRRALRLTIRERLQVADKLSEMLRHFQQMRAAGKFNLKTQTTPSWMQVPGISQQSLLHRQDS